MLPQPPLWLILIAFICALGPLVFFHELGHYLVARWFKIPAETFSIGFGREIFGWTDQQGTRWRVAWLPLGGYVKFVGDMTPASNRPGGEASRSTCATELPVAAGLATVPGGARRTDGQFPAGDPDLRGFLRHGRRAPDANVVGEVQRGSAAERAGVRAGDRILPSRIAQSIVSRTSQRSSCFGLTKESPIGRARRPERSLDARRLARPSSKTGSGRDSASAASASSAASGRLSDAASWSSFPQPRSIR